MVIILPEPNCVLNNCMPANVIKHNILEKTHDNEVGRAEI